MVQIQLFKCWKNVIFNEFEAGNMFQTIKAFLGMCSITFSFLNHSVFGCRRHIKTAESFDLRCSSCLGPSCQKIRIHHASRLTVSCSFHFLRSANLQLSFWVAQYLLSRRESGVNLLIYLSARMPKSVFSLKPFFQVCCFCNQFSRSAFEISLHTGIWLMLGK